jgi:hypothetical protein
MSNKIPSFPHRVPTDASGRFYNLNDTISPSLERAAAIADLIEVATEFSNDPEDFETRTLSLAAQAIRLELMDAQALIEAYIEQEAR